MSKIIVNAKPKRYQVYKKNRTKDGHSHYFQVYAGLNIKQCKLKQINEKIAQLVPGKKWKIFLNDKWTSTLRLNLEHYYNYKNTEGMLIEGMLIEGKYLSNLGNSPHEFELMKGLSDKGLFVWRNRIKGFDFSVTKDFKNWTDIEVTSTFPTDRWTNINYLIVHIWRVLRRNHAGFNTMLILNLDCADHEDIKIAEKLGVNIKFAEFSPELNFRDRKILNMDSLVNEILREIK